MSIGGRNITNLRFADDIDSKDEKEQKLEALAERLDKTCTGYKMGIRAEKTQLMTNNADDIQWEIKEKGQNLLSNTFKLLPEMMTQKRMISQGLHQPLQLLKS